jgi:hypothetical protein
MTGPKVKELPVRSWRVEVTDKHINKGTCGNPKRCAVALAIADLEGMDCVDVRLRAPEGSFRVSRAEAFFDYKWTPYEVALPPEVARFIADFDMGKLVRPFVFELSLAFAIPIEKIVRPGSISL